MAEREGFEPPVPCGTPDFESGTFDHSATSPLRKTFLIHLKLDGKKNNLNFNN